jgi:hypothetical protein
MPHPGAEEQCCERYAFFVVPLLCMHRTRCQQSDRQSSLVQEKEASLNGTRPSSSPSLTTPPRSSISRSWTATLRTTISLVKRREYPGIFHSCVYRIALQPSKSTSSSFCTNFSSRAHASELSVALYLSPQACLTPLLMPVCTSQLSASPWRLCFRKAAFLRQLTQSSRRRNTAERSSLHSPSLQQWYVPRNVLAAANSHAMPR